MSATEGLLPRIVVSVERCVFKDERRWAVFAASSVGEAMCADVVSHCSISTFSPSVYSVLGQTAFMRSVAGYSPDPSSEGNADGDDR